MPNMDLRIESQTGNRQKMIEQALKDKAPKTYRQLKSAGKLQDFVKDQDEQMMESYHSGEVEAIMHLPEPKDYLENLQNQVRAKSRLWEETLATYLEFSDPEEEESKTPLKSIGASIARSFEKEMTSGKNVPGYKPPEPKK